MKLSLFLSLLLAVFTSAQAADPPPVYLDPPPLQVSSHVVNRSSVRPARGRVFDLVRGSEGWRYSEVDELVPVVDLKHERILVDETARMAWLVVDRDVPQEINTGVVGRSGQPAHMWRCREAMSDNLKDRARFGYSPCNTYFSRQQVMRRLPDKLLMSQLNTEQLYQVIEESGLLFVLDNRYSDRRIYLENRERLNLYRREFARADTEERLEAFITHYREDDPDKLIPRAEERLRQISKVKEESQRSSYLEAYAAARTLKDYQQFIDQYAEQDPLQLVPHVRQLLEWASRPTAPAAAPAPAAPAITPAPNSATSPAPVAPAPATNPAVALPKPEEAVNSAVPTAR